MGCVPLVTAVSLDVMAGMSKYQRSAPEYTGRQENKQGTTKRSGPVYVLFVITYVENPPFFIIVHMGNHGFQQLRKPFRLFATAKTGRNSTREAPHPARTDGLFKHSHGSHQQHRQQWLPDFHGRLVIRDHPEAR